MTDVVLLFGVVTNGKAAVRVCKELKIPVVHRTLDIIHETCKKKIPTRFCI